MNAPVRTTRAPCGEYDGCDKFWKFIEKLDWESRPDLDELERLMRENWSIEEIAHFDKEFSHLTQRLNGTIEHGSGELGLCGHFGGGDDHT